MKGENNSLKKKVQSLQTDFEKLSRKITTTQARSSADNSDENYGDNKTCNQTSSVNGGGHDLHNQSVQSDVVQSKLRPGNKLDMRRDSFAPEDQPQQKDGVNILYQETESNKEHTKSVLIGFAES